MSQAKILPDIILKDLSDPWVRENFWRLDKFFKAQPLFKGVFKFFELTFPAAVVAQRIPHGLGLKPLDVIQTSSIGTGVITWLYPDFTTTDLFVTTTGPVVVRAFVGSYKE